MLNSPILHVPLISGADGEVRLVGSEVLLGDIVADFEEGLNPEDIAERWPGVSLADVFLVLAFYLRERRSVERHLARRRRPKPAA